MSQTKIRYRIEYIPHPWNEKMRADGTKAWCIVRKVELDERVIDQKPIALFHFDSEGETFQRAILTGAASLECDPEFVELVTMEIKAREKRAAQAANDEMFPPRRR